MGSNAKIQIITHWSIHICLLLVMSRVKFARLMSVDPILSLQSNIHHAHTCIVDDMIAYGI